MDFSESNLEDYTEIKEDFFDNMVSSKHVILETESHTNLIIDQDGDISTLKEKFLKKTREQEIVGTIISSTNEFIGKFYQNHNCLIKKETNFNPKRLKGQLYSRLTIEGPSISVSDIYDSIATAMEYFIEGLLENYDIQHSTNINEIISLEEIDFLDEKIEEFLKTNSAKNIELPFDFLIGFSGTKKITFQGRFRKKTIHQLNDGAVSTTIKINGFDDIKKEINGTIVSGENSGKKIKLHNSCAQVFLQAAEGYGIEQIYNVLYRTHRDKKGNTSIKKLLSFKPVG